MAGLKPELDAQLKRQSLWLQESWLWLLRTRVLEKEATRLSALDVGCGPGHVMELVSPHMDVRGLDLDPAMVSEAKSRGLNVAQGPAEKLPFEDGSFDIVYCTFLLLWVKDPVKVVSEMARVSKRWVACLAEPDFGARLDFPDAIAPLRELIVKGMKREGGDPFIGRKLRGVFARCGMDAEVGAHLGVWSIDKLKEETPGEWRYLQMTSEPSFDSKLQLERIRSAWDKALADRSLFQFNPVFYALAKK
jgi:ubiquinone/menaquinone biosynthesis C-methylase UbiE